MLLTQWSLYFKTTHQPEKCGLQLKVVLKWRDNYIENIRMASVVGCLKIQGNLKVEGLKLQGLLHYIQWNPEIRDTQGTVKNCLEF